MNCTTRAARTLHALPDDDASVVLDALEHAVRCACAEPVAPGVWTVTATCDGMSYRITFGAPEGITTVLAVSLAEPP